ncbi:MAG: hypothetical protein AAFQ98_02590 [Bacteroidota bacterium]
MSKATEKINWRNHLIEFLMITLGIMLAFGLNTWWGNHKESKQAQLYLEGLEAELLDNQRQLRVLLPYHLHLMQGMRDKPQETILQLNSGFLSKVAWMSANHTLLKQHIDLRLYTQLSTTYNLHDKLSQHISFAGNQVHELNVMAPFYLLRANSLTDQQKEQLVSELGRGWVPVLEDWSNYEKLYLREISKSLAHMESPERYQVMLDSLQIADSLLLLSRDSLLQQSQ